MQTIQIENDLYQELVKYGIDVQSELKNIVNNFLEKKKKYSYLDSKEFQKDKAYFQEALEEIESGKTELLDTKSYNQSMNMFVEELKVKYGNS